MWIARDKNNDLYIYSDKPIKETDGKWNISNWDTIFHKIDNVLFPEVQWEDEEPRELVLKPINKRQQ